MSVCQLLPQATGSHGAHLDTQTLETSLRNSTESWDLPDWQITHEACNGGTLKLHLVLPIWLVLVGADLQSVTNDVHVVPWQASCWERYRPISSSPSSPPLLLSVARRLHRPTSLFFPCMELCCLSASPSRMDVLEISLIQTSHSQIRIVLCQHRSHVLGSRYV